MIGKMDRLVTLQTLAETNSFGELVQTWTDIKDVWAYIYEPRGSEALESARLNATDTIRIRIRYRTDVNVTCRIVIDGQNYSVVAIDRTQRRNGYLWITAKLVGAL